MVFLGILGFLIFFGGLIWLIVAAIQKKKKRLPLILLIVGVVVFFGAVVGTSTDKDTPKTEEKKEAYDISKLKNDLKSGDFVSFLDDYDNIPKKDSSRTDAWDQLSGTNSLAKGTLINSDSDSIYLFIGDYSGQTWDSVKNNKDMYHVLIGKLKNPSEIDSLEIGKSYTIEGSLDSRGDKDLDYNWKMYKVKIK